MEKINHFIDLTRVRKPIGFMLLFWPCLWGLTIGFDFSNDLQIFFKYSFLFFCGSVLMRSAGCIINDIVDKDFDSKVDRTKNRPIASGKISLKLGLTYAFLLCIFAFIILLQFNFFTIILALCSMPLAFSYPFMKRFTYWPQLFLGITFNYGVILGWTSVNENLNLSSLILYVGAIFWTLGYDTVYGFQDIKDDEIIGVKSTSIKFKHNAKLFLSTCYSIFILSLLVLGNYMKLNYLFYVLLIIPIIHLIFMQINKFDKSNGKVCLSIFKSNNLLGFVVFINLLLGKI